MTPTQLTRRMTNAGKANTMTNNQNQLSPYRNGSTPTKQYDQKGHSSSSSTGTSVLTSKVLPLVSLVVFATVTLRQGLGMYTSMSLESSLLSLDIEKALGQHHCDDTSTHSGPNNVATPTTPYNSSTATVLAMATGYRLDDYERFVGSLRKTGYSGHIILAVSPTIEGETKRYLERMNVKLHLVQKTNCTYTIMDQSQIKTEHDKEIQTCLHPYPTLKHRWARYPLLRDLLIECTTCTGPVLHTDLRDTFFQRDPFGVDQDGNLPPPVHGLQVFEEHYTIRTTNWVSDWPVFDCKGIHIDEPMLCSGTTVGTRTAMIEYFNVMHEEMDTWMASPKCCCFQTNADDQSMHNWLFYGTDLLWQRPPSKQIDGTVTELSPTQLERQRRINAVAVPNRQGIVHTVGAHAALIHQNHMRLKEKYLPKDQQVNMHGMPFDGSGFGYDGRSEAPNEWLGIHHGLTDIDGYLIQNDGTRSYVVHQIDRFGPQYFEWIHKNRDKLLIGRNDV